MPSWDRSACLLGDADANTIFFWASFGKTSTIMARVPTPRMSKKENPSPSPPPQVWFETPHLSCQLTINVPLWHMHGANRDVLHRSSEELLPFSARTPATLISICKELVFPSPSLPDNFSTEISRYALSFCQAPFVVGVLLCRSQCSGRCSLKEDAKQTTEFSNQAPKYSPGFECQHYRRSHQVGFIALPIVSSS